MSLPSTDEDVLFLHNPRCSKSRAVASILTEREIAHRERRYLDEPLTREELAELGRRLDLAPSGWIRTGETMYSELGLGPASSDDELLDAMAAHPVLMQRPILVTRDSARIGRPPQAVLELFDD